MRNSKLDPKVLIVGGGPVGLFTALKLCQLGVPIRIIDESPKADQQSTQLDPTSTPTRLSPSSSYPPYDCLGTILLLSPRALQLLQSLDLFDDVIAQGVKHWQLQIHSGTSSSAAPVPFTAAAPFSTASSSTPAFDAPNLSSDTVYSYKLWESKATDHNFCLSIEQSTLCYLLASALDEKYSIQIDHGCELVDLQYSGGLGNTVFMENELDSNFYFGGGRMDPITTFAAPGVVSSIQPMIATIRYQEQQSSYQQDCIQVCQTHYMVVTTGKSNTVQQKLEDKFQAKPRDRYWQQQIQRDLSVKRTASYKKSMDDAGGDDRRFCYSLVAKMKTNYPELKPISIVAKPEGTLLFLVHNNYASMMIQQKKGLTKEPLSLMKIQRLVQKLIQPYDIEFLDTYSYYYWKDSTFSTSAGSDARNMDNRLFFLGDASHCTHPPGWLSPDLGFEQATNLCWKLNLHLQRRSTSHLLDTYYSETQIKKKDASMASNVLLRLLRDPISIMKSGGMAKLLQEHRHCFIGGLLLDNNILNLNCPQARKVQHGSVGTLAPNARLKPYHLSQLLTQQNSHHYTKSPPSVIQRKHSVNQSSTDDDILGQQNDQVSTNKLKFLRGLFTFHGNKKNQQLTPSSTGAISSPTSITPTNDKWKGIRANHYHLWDQLSSHTGASSARSTFTVLVLCGSLLDYNSIVALRKLKKHLDQSTSFLRSFEYPHDQYSYQQQQQQLPLTQSKSTPIHGIKSNVSITNGTAASFSPITPIPSSSSSSSKTQPQPRRSESSSSFYSVKSSISSIDDSITNDSQYQGYRDSHGASLKSPRSSIFTRFSTTSSTDRYSMATSISNSSIISSSHSPPPPVPPLPSFLSSSVESKFDNISSKTYHSQSSAETTQVSSSPSPLFSFLCLTTSSKLECSRFLSEQTPFSLHQLFPFGLSRTFLDHDQQAHQLYAVKDHKPTIVIIRPDGYVGAQMLIDDQNLHDLDRYFDQILLPVVDFSSAASLVADDYCL